MVSLRERVAHYLAFTRAELQKAAKGRLWSSDVFAMEREDIALKLARLDYTDDGGSCTQLVESS